MRKLHVVFGMAGLAGALILSGLYLAGCESSSPPPQMPVPPPGAGPTLEREEVRPLPEPRARAGVPRRPFEDVPLVTQTAPEQREFARAYEEIGRPTIAVFVNRALDAQPLGQDRTGTTNELGTRSIDYEAMENVLTDQLAARGQIELISPTGVRERLTEQQERDLESGQLEMSEQTARRLDADVLVQVRARTTRQTPEGPEIRVVAEAINLRGGQSIARAMVDVPPPLTRQRINRYTYYLARELMSDMSQTWERMSAEPPSAPRAPTEPGPRANDQ